MEKVTAIWRETCYSLFIKAQIWLFAKYHPLQQNTKKCRIRKEMSFLVSVLSSCMAKTALCLVLLLTIEYSLVQGIVFKGDFRVY